MQRLHFTQYLRRSSDMMYIKELTGSAIDALQTVKSCRLIKIGQTKSYLGDARHQQLNNNNSCNLTDIMPMLSLSHPYNIMYKLTDHRVRNHIINTNSGIVEHLDKNLAQLLGVKDGGTELVMFPPHYTNKQICNIVMRSYEELCNSSIDNFVSNKETETTYNKDRNEFIVSTNTISQAIMFYNMYKKLNPGQKVLVIRQHADWLIDRLICMGLDVTYIIDNNNAIIDLPECDNLHIVFTDNVNINKKEMIDYIMTMPKQFDLLIANPPYKYANEIIAEAMKHCKEGVVLMPFSKYNGRSLYKQVVNIKDVDSSAFSDAAISENTLCIAHIVSEHDNNVHDWSQFKAKYKTNEQYREFYILNQLLPKTSDTRCNRKVAIDVSTTFMISPRVGDNGVHKSEDCYDYRFNVLENLPEEEWSINTPTQWNFTPYRLPSVKAKKNLCRFWYNNPLMNTLIKNSGESSSSFNVAMPRINWELDLDWEHLTYEELLTLVKQQLTELGINYETV